MDSMAAFARGEAARAAGATQMVFDWNKAAELIRDKKPSSAGAGLADDWEYTGGDIYRDGKPVPKDETYTFLSSNWATPELSLDGEIVECWRDQEGTGWGSRTYWPESALAILAAQPSSAAPPKETP